MRRKVCVVLGLPMCGHKISECLVVTRCKIRWIIATSRLRACPFACVGQQPSPLRSTLWDKHWSPIRECPVQIRETEITRGERYDGADGHVHKILRVIQSSSKINHAKSCIFI